MVSSGSEFIILKQDFCNPSLRRSSADSSVANSPARCRGAGGGNNGGNGGGGVDLQREIFQYKQMRFNKEGGGGGGG